MASPPALPPFKPPDFKIPAQIASRIMARLSALTTEIPKLAARARTSPRAVRLESWSLFTARLVADQLRAEWAGSPPHRWLISRPLARSRAASPHDLRPPRTRRGRAILAGRFTFDGLVLEPGLGAGPWDRPSPSHAFAVALHGMNWLPDLLSIADADRTALQLVLGWQAVFGRWNGFSWSPPVLERRVFNLACNLRDLCAQAPDADQALLLNSLARQARHLLLVGGRGARAAEQAAAAAVAGCALGGEAGEQLREKALRRLEGALRVAVLPDGGHASRSPEAAMELLFDLRTLDEALQQLGREAPEALSRAIDRLTGALRFFTLPDGRLPATQGGEAGEPERIAAALSHDDGQAPAAVSAPYAGYERLVGKTLQVMVDVGAPAAGAWSAAACAQPLTIEVLAGAERLIANTGWSPRAASAQALRLTPAGSCANVADASAGEPLRGMRARILGHRLEGGARQVQGRRHEAEGGAWLEYSHDGWAAAFGVSHERRLYLDYAADELRGEDILRPAAEPFAGGARRQMFLIVRFQLHPQVKASLAMDHKSVMLQAPAGGGWWLRNDAPEVRLEPGVHLVEGRPQHTSQVVMRALMRRDGTARVRWKLSAG
jgi:uncharacterized heparinase superfamily protein